MPRPHPDDHPITVHVDIGFWGLCPDCGIVVQTIESPPHTLNRVEGREGIVVNPAQMRLEPCGHRVTEIEINVGMGVTLVRTDSGNEWRRGELG